MTIFLNGKQVRVPRPRMIKGVPEEEFIRRNADPIWLHMNEMWEYMGDHCPMVDSALADPRDGGPGETRDDGEPCDDIWF